MYSGAILLSDQIHYYINELNPPLLHNPDGKQIGEKDLDEWRDDGRQDDKRPRQNEHQAQDQQQVRKCAARI